ncbi:MAG: hypothetical protein JSU68_06215, partial [Phycisphaerales bacterium]
VYYGHPNPARGQLAYQADLADGTPHMPPISTLPRGSVVTGVKEYASAANGGQMQGMLLLTGFLDGSIHYVSLSVDGLAATGQGVLAGGFANPIDLAVGPDGTIYVLEAGGTLSFGGIGPAKLTALVPEQPAS